MTDYDWLIIGGGLHGRFIAESIRRAAPDAAIAIVDPSPPLAAWRRRADACGMTHLRSTSVHHLGRRADSLRCYARAHGFDGRHALGYYRRPSRELFEAHALSELGDPYRLAAAARALEPAGAGWAVITDQARHTAARVVLATGPGLPHRPPGLAAAEHVFDPDFTLGAPGRRVAVVGGGITGAQLALRATAHGHRVCWVTRTPPRAADFDSDPCYAGPRCLTPLQARPMAARTALIAAARQPGTLPPDVHAHISAALAAGDIAWQRADPVACDNTGLRYADGRHLAADRVLLATGFDPVPAADSLLGDTIRRLDLATDNAGHVCIDTDLQAAPGLHLAGRPASLQLGPMAGNIKGARLAGARLADLAARRRYRAAG